MGYHEKQGIVSILTSLLTTAAFAFWTWKWVLAPEPALAASPVFWGKTFLLFIAVAIGVQILATILTNILHRIITGEKGDLELRDERDRAIELRGERVSHYLFIAGLMASMATQAMGKPLWTLFVGLAVAGIVSGITGEIVKVVLYRRGT